ncbi:ABC transporter permease [Sinomicrobium pectinilyticum]|uniref:ABC transporter permease n=1 Tax=Sinomicrobium pectinilyticum TaxID=1084421 RepID=A0A3N0ES70_SINP1|nr:ABC transporter permease [Sinomicrobium pectinilyticum]RNL90632.1 ABC transporter permease [Sinomicrobium pectinilyticum]
MIKNYFKIAWRNLWNHKTYSFLNIFGLALGMAVAIMIGLWIKDELDYNNYFKDREQIAQVFQNQTFNNEIHTVPVIPRPLEMVLRNNYRDYFKHIVMSSGTQEKYLRYGETNISKRGYFMQENAPEMLWLDILKGETNGLQEKNSIMLSASCAKALFGAEDPIGKIVEVGSQDQMKVTGIYNDIPYNNGFDNTDFIMPWKHFITTQNWVKESADNWGNNSFQLFVQIADNTSMKKVSSVIKDVKKNASAETRPFNPEFMLLPMKDWHLRSNFENGKQVGGRIEYVWLFGTIGIFVLLLACINFMNMSTARSEKRAREVGIRKTIGSVRSQLISQFLSESFLVVVIAFMIALVIILLLLGSFNDLARKEIIFPWNNATFWISSTFLILLTALLAGSYPALYLSSFRPVKVLKGTFRTGRFSTVPRKVLVVVQFTVSIVLIIGTLIIQKQIQYTKDRPSGYDKAGLIQIPVMSSDYIGKYELMRNTFLGSGAAVEMSSSSSPTTSVWSNRSGYTWDGKAEGFQEDFAWTNVSYDYAKSLDLKFISGRDFSREFPSDTNAVIINRTAAQYMGLKDPVGKYLRDTDADDPELPLQIIGVVEDMIMQSPYEPVKQTVYAFDKYESASYYNLRLNPDNSISENLATLEKVFKKQFPHLPFQYQFIDEKYAEKFASEERIAGLAGIFTGLAIFISCLGLFGLASFIAEQRTKELGIRKVLGATVANLWLLLSKDFMLLIVISLFLASPLAYYFMSSWIQKYAYRINISSWVFLVAGAGALIIAMLTVSFQAIKTAMANPVKSLKTE